MSEDSETPANQLDDERDREELRNCYYGLMQELRIVLPGVQVLVAFLLTVPFAQGFAEIDDFSRGLFGAALVAAILSVVAFIEVFSPASMTKASVVMVPLLTETPPAANV